MATKKETETPPVIEAASPIEAPAESSPFDRLIAFKDDDGKFYAEAKYRGLTRSTRAPTRKEAVQILTDSFGLTPAASGKKE